jgi:hypothetical protein
MIGLALVDLIWPFEIQLQSSVLEGLILIFHFIHGILRSQSSRSCPGDMGDRSYYKKLTVSDHDPESPTRRNSTPSPK